MRSILLQLLHTMGFFRLWLKLQPNSVTILMLHGVMDDEEPTSQWRPFRSYLSRQNLENDLSLLSRYFDFTSMDRAIDMLEGRRPLDRHYCVLTFDDGLLNNLTHAMPVLRRHGVPATMYLVSGQVERREPFWFDRLDYAIQQSAHLTPTVKVFEQEIALEHGSPAAFKRSFLRIKNAAFETNHDYTLVSKEIERVTQELESRSGKSLLDIYDADPWSKVMSWKDVEAAARDEDVTFGSHTVDHSLLGKIGEIEIEYQLKASKEALENHTRKPCVHFCYPNGSLHPKAAAYLASTGYLSAVTTARGNNQINSYDRFHLKRYNLPPDSAPLHCLAKVSGFGELFG